MRIAVAGWQHESNTFASEPADLDAFLEADAWPGLVEGAALAEAVCGANLPAAGFIEAAERRGHRILPVLWASGTPSGPVTAEAFETIAGRLVEGLRQAAPFDAVYLDLHGAMVGQGFADADGEILRRVRREVGRDAPLVASLDFHANVSAAMVDQADALVGYRTYPHVDMAETGARAATLLERIAARRGGAKAFGRLPFLLPLVWQCTLDGPMAELMDKARSLEGEGVDSLSFLPGFPLADVECAGPSIVGYGSSAARVRRAVDEMQAAVARAAPTITGRLFEPAEAIGEARRLLATPGEGPVVLADTQDNPGGGGTGDTVGLLRRLLDSALPAVVGVVHDPEAAAAACAAGVGATLCRGIGARSRHAGEVPVEGAWRVDAIGTGDFVGTGPFYGGCRFALGRMATLSAGKLKVVVSSRRQQAADQAMFRHVGIEPAAAKVLALKSSVHFRADFGALARAVLVVRSPGANTARLSDLSFKNLPVGTQLLC